MNECVCGLDICNDCDVCDDCVKICDCNICECTDDIKCDYCVNLVNLEKLEYLHHIRINSSYLCDIKELSDISSYDSFYSNDGDSRLVFIKSVNNNVTVILYDYCRCDVKVYDLKDFKLSSDF